MSSTNKFRLGLCLLISLTIISSVVFLVHKKESSAKPRTVTTQVPTQQPSQPLKAGGQTVPEKSRAKAQSLGYYCPSWDAPAGTASSTVCYSLDK